TAVAVNPLEGEVAIATPDGGVVVGRLSNRAIRWVEETLGKSFDELSDAVSLAALGKAQGLSVRETTVVIWAAVEDHRRRSGASGPEVTIDDVDEIVEALGIDLAYQRAAVLMMLACQSRLEPIRARAKAAGEPDPVDPLLAAARAADGFRWSKPRS